MTSKNTVGVVLAGGEGSRLRPLTYYFQKCMIPIGPRQRPLLEYIILNMKRAGLNDVFTLVGYKAEQIINYFREGQLYGIRIKYIHDNPELKGTGGALLNLYRQERLEDKDIILIHYGDILSNIDLADVIKKHEEARAEATVALSRRYVLPVGVAEVSDDRIISFTEKPSIDIYVSIGILALNAGVLPELDKLAAEKNSLDIMSDFIPYLLRSRRLVKPYVTDAFWYDVGSIEKYEKLTNELVKKYLAELED
ncbi:MAG: nucleotidyltransferase family protein [Nitrososphaerota archaeon]